MSAATTFVNSRSRVRWIPALSWLRSYEFGWLRGDLVAGVTLAAYAVPAGLGDASLANLPPQAGLYACLFSGLVFWLFCSSRHTAITVTSAISLLMGASLGTLAGGDTTRFGALAAATALLVAALGFLAWVVRAGAIVDFISETVMIGFKTGVAMHIAVSQLPKLFGFKGGHGNFWERCWVFLTHLPQTHQLSLLVGAAALLALIAGRIYLKNRPVALFVVIAAIVVSSLTPMGDRGVALLGSVPQGMPPVGLPAVSFGDLDELLLLAMACFVLAAVETAAIGRTFAAKYGYRLESNQELLAIAGANLAAGLGGGYPVSGGMSQSLVNESAGARTPISGLLAAGLILVVTVFFSGLLRALPQPVLAAIVLMAVASLFKVQALKRLWHFSRSEFAIAFVAILGVLGSGILRGVLIGAIISMLLLLRRASRPHVAVLARVPGTDAFGDIESNPENEPTPGVFVFRADVSLLYFNSEYIHDQFIDCLNRQTPPTRLAIWCLGTTPHVDMAGAEMLERTHKELGERGITLKLAEAHGQARQSLRAAGLEQHFGPIGANTTIAGLIKASS